MNWSEEKKNSFKILLRSYYDYQRERMALDGQLGIKKDGTPKKGIPEREDTWLARLATRHEELTKLEEGLAKDIAKEVKSHSLWKEFLADVKGCGESIAAVLITEVDINKAETVSKLWQFAGMNPGEIAGKVWKKKAGKRVMVATDKKVRGDKKTSGFVCPYNQFLKSKLLGVLGPGFLKANSPYRSFYDNMKQRLESEDWGISSKNPTDKKRPKAGHQHNAANRYMVKMFLKDLYIAWRTIEGLSVRPPYQEEYLKHKHKKAA